MSKMKQRRDPPPNTVNGQDCGQSQKEVSFVEKSGNYLNYILIYLAQQLVCVKCLAVL